MHNTSAIFCPTKAKVLLPPIFLPQQKCPPSPMFQEAENLQQLLVFLQLKTAEENAQMKELKKYYLYSYSMCVVCVYVYV